MAQPRLSASVDRANLGPVGTDLTTIALALLAYDLAGGDAGRVLGIALACKMIAYVGIAPVVGGYAQRLPRKTLLVILDVLRAEFVFCPPWVTAVWQIVEAAGAMIISQYGGLCAPDPGRRRCAGRASIHRLGRGFDDRCVVVAAVAGSPF